MAAGRIVVRDVVEHPGAVGIVALDDSERVLMIRQYRHAVRQYLWEIPAGLLDEAGESAAAAAARELAEEVGVVAQRWSVLADIYSSAGMTDEAYRVYLARGLGAKSAEFVPGKDEEADMREEWVPLAAAVARVLTGDITNGLAAIGILATDAARRTGYAELRPVGAGWPARPDRS